MTDLSHLEQFEEQEVEGEKPTLETIVGYGEALVAHKQTLAELEEQVKAKKKEVMRLEQELLPEAMSAIGINSLELRSGEKLSIKTELSCSVKNYEMLYDFLADRGDDSLMKTSIEVGKLPQNILNMVLRELKNKYDIDGTGSLYIHPQTLKAYFRRLCGIGGEKAQVPLAQISEDMVSAYTYYKVAVTK